MKIQTKNYSTNKKLINTQRKVPFKGNLVVGVMDGVARGGVAASFMSGDLLGSILPRPITGLFRNSKENGGKKNYAYALRELIREVISGPGMFAIPALILLPAKKHIGKALNVPADGINSLGNVFTETVKNTAVNANNFKETYYKDVFSKILKNIGLPLDKIGEEAQKMAADTIVLEGAKKKSFWKQLAGTPVAGSYQDKLAEMTERFVGIAKKYSADISSDFSVATIQTQDGRKYSKGLGTLIKNMSEYADDAIKSSKKFLSNDAQGKVEEFIKTFNKKRIGGRFLLNAALVTAVVLFTCIGPKLYNITKEDPGLAGLQPQTEDKKGGKA